ncbi:MAG TPA: hypothetical protein VI259_12915 [Gemmatimonadaceae bacterium]
MNAGETVFTHAVGGGWSGRSRNDWMIVAAQAITVFRANAT